MDGIRPPTPLFFALLIFAITAYGQQQERVAIINTEDNLDSIGFSELAYLTDRLRETAVNVLPKSRYWVMTTESIVAFLGSQENAAKICKEASCLADLGRKVNADYVAQARIGRFGENLTIKTELYNVKNGNLIGSFTGSSKDISDLLTIIDEKAIALFKKLPGISDNISDLGNNTPKKPSKARFRISYWSLGLNVLGAAIIGYAVYENGEAKKAYDKYYVDGQPSSYYEKSWKDVEDSRSKRNTFYIIGGLVLASGIGVHIWF